MIEFKRATALKIILIFLVICSGWFSFSSLVSRGTGENEDTGVSRGTGEVMISGKDHNAALKVT